MDIDSDKILDSDDEKEVSRMKFQDMLEKGIRNNKVLSYLKKTMEEDEDVDIEDLLDDFDKDTFPSKLYTYYSDKLSFLENEFDHSCTREYRIKALMKESKEEDDLFLIQDEELSNVSKKVREISNEIEDVAKKLSDIEKRMDGDIFEERKKEKEYIRKEILILHSRYQKLMRDEEEDYYDTNDKDWGEYNEEKDDYDIPNSEKIIREDEELEDVMSEEDNAIEEEEIANDEKEESFQMSLPMTTYDLESTGINSIFFGTYQEYLDTYKEVKSAIECSEYNTEVLPEESKSPSEKNKISQKKRSLSSDEEEEISKELEKVSFKKEKLSSSPLKEEGEIFSLSPPSFKNGKDIFCENPKVHEKINRDEIYYSTFNSEWKKHTLGRTYNFVLIAQKIEMILKAKPSILKVLNQNFYREGAKIDKECKYLKKIFDVLIDNNTDFVSPYDKGDEITERIILLYYRNRVVQYEGEFFNNGTLIDTPSFDIFINKILREYEETKDFPFQDLYDMNCLEFSSSSSSSSEEDEEDENISLS